jgi:hypothetical protein
MKRYSSVFDLAKELDAKGYTKDKNVNIPAGVEPDSLSDDKDNQIIFYDDYKAYYIIPAC